MAIVEQSSAIGRDPFDVRQDSLRIIERVLRVMEDALPIVERVLDVV